MEPPQLGARSRVTLLAIMASMSVEMVILKMEMAVTRTAKSNLVGIA